MQFLGVFILNLVSRIMEDILILSTLTNIELSCNLNKHLMQFIFLSGAIYYESIDY